MARVRKGSGVREHDLVTRAKALRGSVAPLLPRLAADCPTDRFDRRRAELEEVRAAQDDTKRLDRLARWGDPLARAYAGLLKFALDPKPIVVITFPLPDGEASFANLAKTDREAEVAVQQYDDPTRLLLGYIDWARKGFHFFAGRHALVCTGRSARPPPEFLTEKLSDLPYRLEADNARRSHVCSHLAAQEPRPYLEVGWTGADTSFRVCRRCVKDDRHLLSSLSDGTASPDPSHEFPVRAELNVKCGGGPECVHASLPTLSRSLHRDYELGRLSDERVLEGYLADVRARVERASRPTFVAGGVCFGSDRKAFLDALRPTATERRALETVLQDHPGYFEVDEPSASRALERLWADHAEEIVRSIVGDPEEARRLVDSARGAPGRIAEILKRAQRQSDEREVLEALPRYRRLAPEAAWVDHVARAFRTQGEGGAERAILRSLPREGKERGLAFGFLQALGRGSAHAWQFSPTEREFGAALADRAGLLLRAPADGYHEALDRLLQSAGVADWGTPEPTAP